MTYLKDKIFPIIKFNSFCYFLLIDNFNIWNLHGIVENGEMKNSRYYIDNRIKFSLMRIGYIPKDYFK